MLNQLLEATEVVGGTLRFRMKETAAEGNVRAKTGTLNGVTSLAGYVETQDDEDLIFSVIINNHLDKKQHTNCLTKSRLSLQTTSQSNANT